MTIEEVKKLTDRELSIKVAELCGITGIYEEKEWTDFNGSITYLMYKSKD